MFNKRLFFTPLEIWNLGYDIRDPGWVKIRIRDKHPGSATLTHGNFSEIWFDINFCFLSARAERRPAPGWPRSHCCSRRRRHHPPRPPPPRWPPRPRPAAAAAGALHDYVRPGSQRHTHTRNAKCFLYLQYIFIRLSNTVRYMDF